MLRVKYYMLWVAFNIYAITIAVFFNFQVFGGALSEQLLKILYHNEKIKKLHSVYRANLAVVGIVP